MNTGATPFERWFKVADTWIHVAVYENGIYVNGVKVKVKTK